MADKNIGALVLVERGTVVGIVSERDCARKLDLRVQITKNLAKSPGNDELIDCRAEQPLMRSPPPSGGQVPTRCRRSRFRITGPKAAVEQCEDKRWSAGVI